MRRLLAVSLLLLFGLPAISPLFALTADSDASLPACCRRNGAHRCMMKLQHTDSSGTEVTFSTIPQRCPAYPAVVIPVKHGDVSFPTASLIFAELISNPSVKIQTQARARVALDRSRQKRGPPKDLL